MAKNDFQYGGWNSYTPQCGTWHSDHDSEFTIGSTVGLPCKVTRGYGIIRQVAASCNVACGSWMKCH